jgi:hypothetical protein
LIAGKEETGDETLPGEEKLFGKSSIEVKDDFAELNEICGVFVTLHKKGELRGCIGNIIGTYPLLEGVSRMALASAFEDPRFVALSEREYPEIDIEITVLSPLCQASAEKVEVGRHGVFISRGYNKGVLLPQVATEHDMDRETFLSQTCLKAGLHKDCWKDKNTKIETFTGDVFSEKELLSP